MGRPVRHILVADNESAICEVVRLGLEADGTCRASTATTIYDALQILTRDPPDAAVVDAVMPPEHGGLAIASQAVDLGIPVLIITGDPDTEDRLDAVGCPYLAKPFRLDELAAELRALLDEATIRRARLSAQLDRLAANIEDLRRAIAAARETVARSVALRASLAKRSDDK